MSTHHPSPAELVLAALAEDREAAGELVTRHLRDCVSCRRELAELRATAHAVRLSPSAPPADECLDEIDLASVLDGVASTMLDQPVVRHLASCARCRAQLAGASRLLREPLVAVELNRVAVPAQRPNRRGGQIAIAGAVAAAALAAVLMWPEGSRLMESDPARHADVYRERTLTTTAAPRILGPLGHATITDSLRWSSVPGADLYRITFWRRDGSVAWSAETRDTVRALPVELTRSGEDHLLWDVRARTGWDRWVVSDLVEFMLVPLGGMPR